KVVNNFDALGEGRVQVHIPSHPELDPWARLVILGGGPSRGFFWVPQIDDEVLAAFNQDDIRDAYVLGGLWSTPKRPSAVSPTDALTQRVIKTGIIPDLGHQIKFDDLNQQITITSTLMDEIVIGPGKVEISTGTDLLKISLNLVDAPPGLRIESNI